MTTQATAGYVNGPKVGVYYADTSTDNTFDNNNMLSSVGDTELGLRQAGQLVTNISLGYTAGGGSWMIRNQTTKRVMRYGWMSKLGTQCSGSTKIMNYIVGKDDVLVVNPYPLDATANQISVQSWVVTSKGEILFSGTNIADNTLTEITSDIGGNSLGTYDGGLLTGLSIQAEDGANLGTISIISSDGGTLWTGTSSVRAGSGGSPHPTYNFKVEGLSIPIVRGMSLKVTGATA